jgi:hypothetical protein
VKYLSRLCSLHISKKGKATLFTIGWHMRGMEIQLHSFLTSALDGYELSPSRSDRLPWKKKIARHPPNEILGGSQCWWVPELVGPSAGGSQYWWVPELVGPSVGLEVLEERKIPCFCRESKAFEICWSVFTYSGYRDGSSQGEHDVSYLRLLLKPLIKRFQLAVIFISCDISL